MECEVCKRGIKDGVTVFRTGKKGIGEHPHWRCEKHVETKIDKEVYRIVKIVGNVEGKY